MRCPAAGRSVAILRRAAVSLVETLQRRCADAAATLKGLDAAAAADALDPDTVVAVTAALVTNNLLSAACSLLPRRRDVIYIYISSRVNCKNTTVVVGRPATTRCWSTA